jgi:hypothetical protein
MLDPFETDKLEQSSAADSSAKEQDRRATDLIRRFMRRSDEYRKPFVALSERARELYNAWDLQSKSLIQRANLRLPYAYSIVQEQIPQLYNICMKDRLPFRVRARTSQFMDFEDSMDDFHSMQLDNMSFSPKFISFLTALAIDGTAITKFPYKYQEQVVIQRSTQQDSILGMSYPTKKEVLEVVYDGPAMENIPLADFFPDWSMRNAGDIQGMRGCVHRTYKNMSELKENEKKGDAGVYKNLNEVEWSLNRKGYDAWSAPYYIGDYDRYAGGTKPYVKNKPIEIWEYWGLFDVDGKGNFQEFLITIANGDVVIRCEENFYDYKLKPFAAAVNSVKDNDFYGTSELFAVRGYIKEAIALRNARLDQVNLAVNRMWLVDRGAGIQSKSLYMRPNGLVFTNDINGLRPIEPPEVPASSFQELQALTNEIQTTVGSNQGPNLSEAGRVFGRSATGASIVSNIAASRYGLKARLICDLYFTRLLDIMLATNAQFISDDQWTRTNDPDAQDPYRLLPRNAFQGDYEFERENLLDEDPQAEAQRIQNAIQAFQVAEQTQPGIMKWDVVFKEWGRDMFGREVKRFFRTDAERQQMQMQQMQMQQQAAAAAGQAGSPGGPKQSQPANAQQGQRAPQPNRAGGQGNRV